jgi:hypothetical protein
MVRAVTSTIIAAPARVASARIRRIEQSSSESDAVTESSGDNGQNDSNGSSTNEDEGVGSDKDTGANEGKGVNEDEDSEDKIETDETETELDDADEIEEREVKDLENEAGEHKVGEIKTSEIEGRRIEADDIENEEDEDSDGLYWGASEHRRRSELQEVMCEDSGEETRGDSLNEQVIAQAEATEQRSRTEAIAQTGAKALTEIGEHRARAEANALTEVGEHRARAEANALTEVREHRARAEANALTEVREHRARAEAKALTEVREHRARAGRTRSTATSAKAGGKVQQLAKIPAIGLGHPGSAHLLPSKTGTKPSVSQAVTTKRLGPDSSSQSIPLERDAIVKHYVEVSPYKKRGHSASPESQYNKSQRISLSHSTAISRNPSPSVIPSTKWSTRGPSPSVIPSARLSTRDSSPVSSGQRIVHEHSPLHDHDPQGSSSTTDGVIGGRALGGGFRFADAGKLMPMLMPAYYNNFCPLEPMDVDPRVFSGKVLLYTT